MKKIINWFRNNLDLILRIACFILAIYFFIAFLGDMDKKHIAETPIGQLRLKDFSNLFLTIIMFSALPSYKKS